jgi:hypothetical protein
MPANSSEYMKEYMKKYSSDKQKTNKYQRSLRIKASKSTSDEVWSKYGYHLVDVIKLQEVLASLPTEISMEIVKQYPLIVKNRKYFISK